MNGRCWRKCDKKQLSWGLSKNISKMMAKVEVLAQAEIIRKKAEERELAKGSRGHLAKNEFVSSLL